MVKKKVLFVCIHNSARSQMAEELLRKLAGERFEVKSAGIEPGKLNPVVVKLLKEEEKVDISHKQTTAVSDLLKAKETFDYIITVCDETAAERCPVFPGKGERLHWGFPDPSALEGSFEEKLVQTREIKDKIKKKIRNWISEPADKIF